MVYTINQITEALEIERKEFMGHSTIGLKQNYLISVVEFQPF